MHDIIPRNNAVALEATYNEAVKKVTEAFELLREAESSLKQVGLLRDISGILTTYRGSCDCDDVVEPTFNHLKQSAWQYIISRLELREMLSLKKREELDRQIQDCDLPDFTAENIHNLIHGFVGGFDNVLEEAVKEVFDLYRPGPWRDELKTNENNRWGLKDKVIVRDVVTDYGINVYREDKLNALDRVFHLLDGKRVPTYPNTLSGIIYTARRAKQRTAETDYFSLKWFRNGNLHIVFKRPDLVREINKIAGRDKLRS